MENHFEIELSMGAKIVFRHKTGSHLISVEDIPVHNADRDVITLDHNEKLRLIKWLINSIEN